MSRYLEGDNVKPQHSQDGRKLIGRVVQYITSLDIDHSGRGYFFPRTGVITDQFKRNLEVNGELIPFSSFVEIVDLREATQEEMDTYRP
jgi:hypothetical protein